MAYGTYHAHARQPSQIPFAPFDSTDRIQLRNNFRRLDKGKPCADIRSVILSSTQSGQCPYCRLGEATTLDHILSKSLYPEYSVLVTNLAPTCMRCNTAKQHNAARTQEHGVFHIYFQGYPLDVFLDVDIQVLTSRIDYRFFFRRPSGVDHAWFDAIQGHFEATELASRYAQRSHVEMQDRAEAMRDLDAQLGCGAVQKYLQIQAASVAHRRSPQDWLHVLLSRAAISDAFCGTGLTVI